MSYRSINTFYYTVSESGSSISTDDSTIKDEYCTTGYDGRRQLHTYLDQVSTAFIQFTRLSYFWSVLPETAGEFLLHFCLKLRARLKGHLFTDSRKILWFTLVSLYSAPISTCQDELVQKEQWYSVEIDIACFGISLHSGYFYLAGKCYSNS